MRGPVLLLLVVLAPGCGAAPRAAAVATPKSVQSDRSASPAKAADLSAATTPRMVIKTAHLEIITSDVADGFTKATAMATRMGGFTLSANRSKSEVSLTLRIPARRFDEALCRLSRLGKVRRRELSGQDVTARYVDLTLRLKNASRVYQRYVDLLARAQTVTETLEVQREMERITGDIESMKGQIKLIENQVSLSTIHVRLAEPVRPGPLGWMFYGLYRGLLWLFVW